MFSLPGEMRALTNRGGFARPLLVCYTTRRRASARFITHIALSPASPAGATGRAVRSGAVEAFVRQEETADLKNKE